MNPDKAQLRRRIRRQRNALETESQIHAAQAVSRYASELPAWRSAEHVAVYLANDSEIDTAPLVSLCRNQGKQLYLPIVAGKDTLEFAAWNTDTTLALNRFGIMEPDKQAERRAPALLDVVFLPLVAWDTTGARLGMGGGFYDRTFAGICGPVLVGLAHTLQQVPRIMQDPWDISLDFVLTDSALHQCKV